jgi:hypothetical protein
MSLRDTPISTLREAGALSLLPHRNFSNQSPETATPPFTAAIIRIS